MLDNWYTAMELAKVKNESMQRDLRNGLLFKMFSEEKKHNHRRRARH